MHEYLDYINTRDVLSTVRHNLPATIALNAVLKRLIGDYMDSLSQVVLGASVAGLVAPSGHRRRALLMGAALGTLPDLDVFVDYDDAVKNFT